MIAICCDCGARFARDRDETWKIRCLSCWAKVKKIDGWRDPDDVKRELAGQMRALLTLCHPDKHHGSPLATRTTQWLLNLRERLGHEVRA